MSEGIQPSGFWRCARCRNLTSDPHVGPQGEDLCPNCCKACTSGRTRAEQEQYVKEHRTSLNPGDPEPGHGLPTTAQSADAEARRRGDAQPSR